MSITKVFLTPETHWDREWVLTFGQYQIRLVNLIDRLIPIMEENPEYRYLLDGQAIVIEDYLEIKPEQRSKLESLFRSGQLISGPWYVLGDQFLQNGESTIRNLHVGMRMIRELGGRPLMLGYVPDSFGSIATLPMLLQGFGIRYATFGRGRPYWNEELPDYEFWWEAPDGSKVLAANHAYGFGTFMSYPDIYKDIFHPDYDPSAESVHAEFMIQLSVQAKHAATGNLYAPVGVDHMEPRKGLPAIVRYINEVQDEYELVYGTPEDYLAAVEREAGEQNHDELKTYRGEMRGPDAEPYMDLVGTLSSRMPIKQANDRCEQLLQRQLEPLAAMHAMLSAKPYPHGHMRKLWKLLQQNHPHDSICGCSLDQVHRDMMNRYAEIEHSGAYLIKDIVHEWQAQIDTRCPNGDGDAVALTVWNPLGSSRTGPVQSLVRVPTRYVRDDYRLYDAAGNEVPSEIRLVKLKQKDLETVYMTNELLATVLSKQPPDDHPDDQVFTVLQVGFIANDVPGQGYKTYWIKGAVKDEAASADPTSQADSTIALHDANKGSALSHWDTGMENESLQITFHTKGTFDVLDKRTGHRLDGLNHFVDREDTGNSYDHHSFEVPQDWDSRDASAAWQVHKAEPHRITFAGTFDWSLPQGLAYEENRRSETSIIVPLTVYVTLHAGIHRADIRIELDNVCRDHCLRLALDTGLHTSIVSAYDHFHVIDRKVRAANLEWRDEPFSQFVDISDGINGLAVSTKGLPAYEAVQSERGVLLYVTLLRSVGSIGPAAGANHPAAEAQCLGRQVFEYALIPHAGDWQQGEIMQRSEDYRTTLIAEADLQHPGPLPAELAMIGLSANKMPSAAKPTISSLKSDPAASLPCIDSGQSAPAAPFISCLKPAEEGDGYVWRVWNPGEARQVYLQISDTTPYRRVILTNLAEVEAAPHVLDEPLLLSGRGLTTIALRK